MQDFLGPSDKIYSIFVGFLENIFPDLAERGEIDSFALHSDIANLLPFGLLNRHNVNKKMVYSILKVKYIHPDMEQEENLEIPIIWHENSPKKHPKSVDFHYKPIQSFMNVLAEKYSLSIEQLEKFVLLNLALTHLFIELNIHEKVGRDFAQSQYLLDLLQNNLPNLSVFQAKRFYYWGLLKFDVCENLSHWQSDDAFQAYLAKFQD